MEASAPPRRLNRIEALLVERGVVSTDALATARDRQRGAKKPLVEVLLEQEAVDEDQLVTVLAEATGMAVLPADALAPEHDVQGLIDADTAQRLGLLPLRVEEDVLVVATGDPLQVVAFDEIAQRSGRRIRPVFAKPSDVRAAMRRVREGEEAIHETVKNAVEVDLEMVPQIEAGRRDAEPDSLDVHGTVDDGPTIKLVNLVIADGIKRGASDIHVECEQDGVRVRFRIDGELQEILRLPRSAASSVISRIKIVAGLDIIETRLPQDGRSKVTSEGRTFDLRVSTLPSYFGEKAVIRILDPNAATFRLDRSGIDTEILEQWRQLASRPNGLILMTGPTGSGKTSTLYATLLEIRDPTLNIVTVEDPVEYQFPGIVHVPVRSDIGMTFAAALRSILRQDPDVVLLGEIRDAETAQVAVQAAMTGHLVLSTLHTNDAFGAIPRLLDLGVDKTRLTSCLAGVMAQRLARTVCAKCATPCEPGPADLAGLGALPENAQPRRGEGCPACRGTGSLGRTAVAELITMTPGLAQLLHAGADESALREQVERDGTRPLVADGLRKIASGLCTPEQIRRVAQTDGDTSAAASAAAEPDAVAKPDGACPSCSESTKAVWSFCPLCGTELPAAADGPLVVVCDDESVSRRLAAGALRKEFPRCLETATGREALDAIATNPPDLLVVDMEMPGLSGVEVIRTLRADLATAALPIIMLTGSEAEDLEEISLEAGADDYLRKPANVSRLRTRARALLRARRRFAGSS